MKALSLLLCITMLMLTTGCATCHTQPGADTTSSVQQETKTTFFDWFIEQTINNLISWAF